jgi:aminobenzoyl-glutamate transport protein
MNGLQDDFDNIGNTMVLIFFLAQLIGLINWTNLGTVLATNLVDFLGSMQFSGIFLILMLFLIVVLIGMIMSSSIEKWTLLSPVIVPLFMRSNMTPDFTQFIFNVADGVAKSISPIFIFLIFTIGLLNKYNTDEKNDLSIMRILKMSLPSILMIAGIWILIIMAWYMIGLPLGINTMPNM